MKNEKKSFFSFMKTWAFWVILGAFCFTSFFIYQNRKVIERDGSEEMISCSDSLALVKSENAALRQALAAKMESHCDTMTVDQKLAQQKLDEYQSKMYEIKETQKSKAYSQKEVARSKAYDAKENSNVSWDNYSKTRTQATLELEKADPKVFAAYAVISFKEEKCYSDSYEFNKVLYKNREKIEKTAIVAEYLKKVQTADAIRSRLDGELGKKYQSQIAEIEKKYQTQLVAIESNYSKKIATKKIELGL